MTDEQFDQLMQLNSAMYIQLCRIYDLMLVSGDKQGVDTIAIKEMHTLGKTFSPYPVLVEDDEE
jgi:hypothetical protein